MPRLTSSSRSDRAKSGKPDHAHQRAASALGYQRICGVDEAGRGPLAGPVVVGAVILDPDAQSLVSENLSGLNDSKALSEKARERFLNVLRKHATISVAIVEPVEIDEKNILWASLAGMTRAARDIGADYALIDGNRMPPHLHCPGEAIVKGDSRALAIAAASIVAKVTRDQLMIAADARFPGYGFAQHKGYPTRAHKDALERLGPCPIHRRSFAPVKKAYGWS